MRQQSAFLPRAVPIILFRRKSSSKSTTVIKITDVKARTGGGRIRILSLARPSARNAISRQLLWELRSQIDAIAEEYDLDGEELPTKQRFGGVASEDERGPTRALILASEVSSPARKVRMMLMRLDLQVDSCFCAGADLKERAGFSAEEHGFIPIQQDTC